MSRPLMQRRIAELEALFASSKADGKGLRVLEEELKLRHVPRAVALLGEVQALLAGARKVTSVPAPAGELMMDQSTWTSVPRPSRETPVPTAGQSASASSSGPAAMATPRPEPATPPAPRLRTPPTGSALEMDFQEACQIFRTAPGADWLIIEQTRRQLVQMAHPQKCVAMDAKQRALALTAAKRANAAYALLWQWRTEGR
jgi:hypothetical protein